MSERKVQLPPLTRAQLAWMLDGLYELADPYGGEDEVPTDLTTVTLLVQNAVRGFD